LNGGVILPKMRLPFDIVMEFTIQRYEDGKVGLKYYRNRMDKEIANNINVATKVWNNMNNPFTVSDIVGGTVRMVTSYHNYIKRQLLERRKGGILFDIGSGKGADISKWYHSEYDIVYAIEPNPENYKELRTRLSNKQSTMTDQQKLRTTIIPLNIGAENHQELRKHMKTNNGKIRKINTISFFNSTTYFWKDEQTFASLMETFSQDDLFDHNDLELFYLSLDGDTVLEFMAPQLRPEETNPYKPKPIIKYYENSLFSIKLDDLTNIENPVRSDIKTGRIVIDIKNTIVQNQTEWLPTLGNLTYNLKQFGMKQLFQRRADKQKFITSDALKLTRLYSYGVYASNMLTSIVNVKKVPIKPSYDLERTRKYIEASSIVSDVDINEKPLTNKKKPWGIKVPRIKPDSQKIKIKSVPKINPRKYLRKITKRHVINVQERIGLRSADLDDYISFMGSFRCRNMIGQGFGDIKYAYRIGCIQNMLSLIHCILKATVEQYRNNRSYSNRRCLAYRFYNELTVNGYPSDEVSFMNLNSLFNIISLDLLEEICKICLIVVQSKSDNSFDVLYADANKITSSSDRYIIVVNYGISGYELVSVRSSTEMDKIRDIRMLFTHNDDFIKVLLEYR